MSSIRCTHGNLVYTQSGAGAQTVTLLHGLYCCKEFWDGYLPLLPPECRAIVPDLLGHGDSDEGRRHGTTEHVDALRELLDRLGVERTSLIGHSMGGVALTMRALQMPLLNVGAHALNRWYCKRQARDGDVVWARMLLPSRRTIVESVRGLKTFERNGAMRHSAQLSMPMLCLHGSRDAMLGRHQVSAAQKRLPQARHVVVPDSHHGWPISDEARFAQIANPFLKAVSSEQ